MEQVPYKYQSEWWMGRKWCRNLVDVGGLYERFPINTWPDDAVAICYNRSAKSYMYDLFLSYLTFDEFQSAIPVEERHFFEVIVGRKSQKPHFDVDVHIYAEFGTVDKKGNPVSKLMTDERGNPLTASDARERNKSITKKIIPIIIEAFKSLIPEIDVERDVLVYASAHPIKSSYHIIIDHWCHANNHEAALFYRKVVEYVLESGLSELEKSNIREIIDPSVYNPNQVFRMLGSAKPGKENYKLEDSDFFEHKYDLPLEYANPSLAFRVRLAASLVGNTTGCRHIEGMETDETREKMRKQTERAARRGHGELEIQPERVQRVFDFLDKWMNVPAKTVYEVRDIDGDRINLTRLAPFECKVCSKARARRVVHEHENPCVVVNPKTDEVFFMCRRARDSEGRYVSEKVGDLKVPESLHRFKPEEKIIPVCKPEISRDTLLEKYHKKGQSQSEKFHQPYKRRTYTNWEQYVS